MGQTSAMDKKLVFRPLTALCLAVAAACVIVAIVYFTKTAADLPSFFPGHQAGNTKHHTKHGLAMVGLAVLAVVAAWFTTAPDRSRGDAGAGRRPPEI